MCLAQIKEVFMVAMCEQCRSVYPAQWTVMFVLWLVVSVAEAHVVILA